MKKEIIRKVLNDDPNQAYTLIEQEMKQEILPQAKPARNEPGFAGDLSPPPSKQPMPNEFIMNPLLSVYTAIDDLSLDVSELRQSNKTLENLLQAILEKDSKLLDIELARVDEGGISRKRGVATKTQFFFVDCIKDIGHMVKGIIIKNDGPSTIFGGFNVPLNPEINVDIVDTISDLSRFEEILNGESIRFNYKENRIASVHTITDPNSALGNSTVRLWFLW